MAEPLAASRLVTNANAAAGAPSTSQSADHAGIAPRVIAYLIDSVVLGVFAMLFVAVALVNIYASTDSGQNDPSDAALRNSMLLILGTVPAWFAAGVLLDTRRGQTPGKYFVGLRVVRQDGGPAGLSKHALHWLALHPLLFNPIMGIFWALLAVTSVSFSGSQAIYLGSFAVALACLLVPLVNFVFALGDPQRRGVHDLIAGTKVVRIE